MKIVDKNFTEIKINDVVLDSNLDFGIIEAIMIENPVIESEIKVRYKDDRIYYHRIDDIDYSRCNNLVVINQSLIDTVIMWRLSL